MHTTARRLLIFALLALSVLPIVWLIPHFQQIYGLLEPYHVEGLWVCWCGSYILANLCTPGFMQGAGNRKEYENSGPRAIIILYFSVMAITFTTLSAVSLALWCLGWLWYFVSLFLYWVIHSVINWITTLLSQIISHR